MPDGLLAKIVTAFPHAKRIGVLTSSYVRDKDLFGQILCGRTVASVTPGEKRKFPPVPRAHTDQRGSGDTCPNGSPKLTRL
jgi:hypothetical protein